MKAAVTNDEHGFDVVDMPDPTPGPDELVIRVAACGVCGSDIKAQPLMPAGMVMGHELGGAIVAVGSRADGWQRASRSPFCRSSRAETASIVRLASYRIAPSPATWGWDRLEGSPSSPSYPRGTHSP
jgi:NADPH:quinone reductase-like Zn-dependent oxidoreductase